MRFVRVLLGLFVLATFGCRSHQLARDQDHIRTAVLDLHTNQIMDNLIRINQGLPIIQLDYQHMTGTVTQTANAGVNGSDTVVGTSNTPFAGLVPASSLPNFVRAVTHVFGYTAGANQVNQLTLNAEPVTDPEVYNAYFGFLKGKDGRVNFMVTSEPPAPEEALIVRCGKLGCNDFEGCPKKHRHKVYYWVPCAAKSDFFLLSLHAVALRGQPVQVSPTFDVAVTDILRIDTADKTAYTVRLKIDKKIPNDVGYIIAPVSNLLTGDGDLNIKRNTEDGVEPADPQNPTAPALSEKQLTNVLVVEFNLNQLGKKRDGNPLKLADVLKDLSGKNIRVRLSNFVPSGPRTERVFEEIRYQLELNRLTQFQLLPR